MTYKALQTNFERELLFHLIFNMKKGNITKGQGQTVAKEFLEVLRSEANSEGFLNSISKKAQLYPEIREAFLIVAKEYETESVNEKILKVREVLKGGLN